MNDVTGISNIFHSIPWYAWIAIVAVVGSFVVQITKLVLRHNERMEKIRQGIDPGEDHPI